MWTSPTHLGEGRVPLRRVVGFALKAAAFTTVAAVVAAAAFIFSLGPAPLGKGLSFSTTVVDREGRLLRPYTTEEGRWRLPATRENVDPRFLNFLFAYEDKRFRSHHGVDALALGRAFAQFIFNGRTVSGGSTLTMQVARLLEPRERTLVAKFRQLVRAIEIERTLSKDDILALYLSLAPYGGNLEGIRAASLAYFGKEPRRLSLAESALLVALPQSPEQRRPDRSIAAARHARDRVLDRVAAGLVPADVARGRRTCRPADADAARICRAVVPAAAAACSRPSMRRCGNL
jgi:penicillin-binding protein 1C